MIREFGDSGEKIKARKKERKREARARRRKNRGWKKFGSAQDLAQMTDDEYNWLLEKR